MSEPGGAPVSPEPVHRPGLWHRYRAAPMWVRIAIPAAIVIVLVGLGLGIAAAVSDNNSTASSTTTTAPGGSDVLLLAVAKELATSPTTTTTIPSTTESTTTTLAPTTEATTTTTSTTPPATTTTAPATTTTAPATTTAPTTTSSTTTTTEASTTSSTTTTTEATTTSSTTTTTEATTTSSTTTTTEPNTSTSTGGATIPLPPGRVALSVDAFQSDWNAAVTNGVPMITSWNQMPIGDDIASVADLGGNIRVVLASRTRNGPVAAAILVWLPLTDDAAQPAQNTLYRNAFAVMMKSVNASVTPDQQTAVATTLGLTPSKPPFPVGASADATLAPQDYRLRAIQPAGQAAPDTMIAATMAA
jgi:hypothetical protein